MTSALFYATRATRAFVASFQVCTIIIYYYLYFKICHCPLTDYAEPYVIGLLPRYVEIRTISPRALIQSIDLPKSRFIAQGKHMYVASTSHVWRLIPVSIPMQIQQLLQDKQFSLALMLAVSNLIFSRGLYCTYST